MTIHVFTTATNFYKDYITEFFIPSFKNFLPNYYKKLIICSDGLDELNNTEYENFDVSIFHIPNIYSFDLILNKFNIIDHVIKYKFKNILKDSDIFFYFDVDTYFYNNSSFYEQNILNEANNNLVNFTIQVNDLVKFNFFKDNIKQIREIRNYDHNREDKGLYAYSPYDDQMTLMASLFFGTIKAFNKFIEYFNLQVKRLLSENYLLIPTLYDEDIANYLYFLQFSNQIEKIINVNTYMTINVYDLEHYEDNFVFCNIGGTPEYIYNVDFQIKRDFIICNQKFNFHNKNSHKLEMYET